MLRHQPQKTNETLQNHNWFFIIMNIQLSIFSYPLGKVATPSMYVYVYIYQQLKFFQHTIFFSGGSNGGEGGEFTLFSLKEHSNQRRSNYVVRRSNCPK